MQNNNLYVRMQTECRLCIKMCCTDRINGEKGYCNSGYLPVVARAALHFWEEPVISGERGSGAVFFSGCSLRCDFCQNYQISRGLSGKEISIERLTEIFFELKEKGAHNINLVTPTHFTLPLITAVNKAKKNALNLPIVWNTSSAESEYSMQLLEENQTADIFLADAKFFSPALSKKYCHTESYFENCLSTLKKMKKITGEAVIDENGIMQKGVIIRLLLMPNYIDDAKKVLSILYEEFGNSVYYSLMNQYTPLKELGLDEKINRKVTAEEYEELIDYALFLGVEKGFIQEGETSSESFIPQFDNSGV